MAQNLQQGRKWSEAMIRGLFMLFFMNLSICCSSLPSLLLLGLFVRLLVNDNVLESLTLLLHNIKDSHFGVSYIST